MTFNLKKIKEGLYEMPKKGEMKVPGRIYGDEDIIKHLLDDVEQGKEWNALVQIHNVACLPGIQKFALAMSDVHPGYGFPIGGVGAFDIKEGVISVAGVGFDINCGLRTLKVPLKKEDIEKKKEKLAEALFREIPAGLGSEGELKLSIEEIDKVLMEGAEFVIKKGFGFKEDLEYIEENGKIENVSPENVSLKAKQRQLRQVGTLGSGNHYLEVQYIEKIFDERAAKIYGLEKNQILVTIHCGSRALGHQIGTDYLKVLEAASRKYGIPIREKELVCAPFKSPEGQRYFRAVNAGINCAFANRQVLAHLTRGVFQKVFKIAPEKIKTFYEIGHNTVKLEEHKVDGKLKKLIVHRKGATRAFGPGRKEIPRAYQEIGQPVLIGGTMGTCSYILSGTQKGMEETFGSACHGAGRSMSRVQAKRKWWGRKVVQDLAQKGIIIKGHSLAGLAEEAPGSYKDVDKVVEVMHKAGIIKKVVLLRPLVCIKG